MCRFSGAGRIFQALGPAKDSDVAKVSATIVFMFYFIIHGYARHHAHVTSLIPIPLFLSYPSPRPPTTYLLYRNFNWVTRRSKKSNQKKKKRVAEPVIRLHPGDKEVTTQVNRYVSSMLAVSLGLKLADSIRRVCMYTKEPQHVDRAFYAVFRGIFPIHELCGTMTALSLARRDILGQPMPLWKMLLPSAIIHGMANFRGMKVRPL
jgi:hypothetical protein